MKMNAQSKTDRDRVHNDGLDVGEIVVSTTNGNWVDFGPDVQPQLLRASPVTGQWCVLFKCAAGSHIGRHEHLGGGEYFMFSGRSLVRGGAENGGITVVAGDYGYEPNGMIHELTLFQEESVLYYSNHGPMKFMDDDNNVTAIVDWRMVRDAAAKAA
jgi:hypothetical protein